MIFRKIKLPFLGFSLALMEKSPTIDRMVDFTTISPHLHVKISPKAKRLALRLDGRARRVNLVIPKRASLKKAYEFAELYQSWIEDKINGLPCAIPYTDGTILPIMGAKRTLRIVNTGAKTTKITVLDSEILVTTHLDDPAPRISRFLRQYAATELEKLANEKAASLGKKLSTFTVRDMRSRWGSCSLDGRMSLSWRLIFAPIEAIDYVVSHECSHLIHDDHGKNFWSLCEKISIDYATGHDWMHKNGSSLGRYGESP
jgi:hypothetical protein